MHLYRATGEPGYLKNRRRPTVTSAGASTRRPPIPRPGSRGFFSGRDSPEMDRPARNVRTDGRQDLPRRPPRGKSRSTSVLPPSRTGIFWSIPTEGRLIPQVERTCAVDIAERVPAWRLSRSGLPRILRNEHRTPGIFMANYAAWMLRLAHYTGDGFLARRTTRHRPLPQFSGLPHQHSPRPYMKGGSARGHGLGANSFTTTTSCRTYRCFTIFSSQALYRSGRKVDFPGEFIEGYACLQASSTVTSRHNLRPRSPVVDADGLAAPDDRQLNYISAVDDDALYIVFMNQSAETVETDVAGLRPERTFRRKALQDAGHRRQRRRASSPTDVHGRVMETGSPRSGSKPGPGPAAARRALHRRDAGKPLRRNAGRRRMLHAGRFRPGRKRIRLFLTQTTFVYVS